MINVVTKIFVEFYQFFDEDFYSYLPFLQSLLSKKTAKKQIAKGIIKAKKIANINSIAIWVLKNHEFSEE